MNFVSGFSNSSVFFNVWNATFLDGLNRVLVIEGPLSLFILLHCNACLQLVLVMRIHEYHMNIKKLGSCNHYSVISMNESIKGLWD